MGTKMKSVFCSCRPFLQMDDRLEETTMKRNAEVFTFDGIEMLISEQFNTRSAYHDVMDSIRGMDVEDILRESPAFNPDDEVNH